MSDLVAQLKGIVGDIGLISGDDLRARAASTLDPSSHQALALVRPQTTDELSKVMAWCHEQGQTVVIQGGMTGLVDGATAGPEELAISLERMNLIEPVDTAGRTLTVAAGATIQKVQEAAAEHQLLFPVDWGARGSAMVGGAIATNAGGNSVLRYGMMREQVLGLEVVLADGTVLSSMNNLIKNNSGYDLKQLFIGSEGTLGIITQAVFRLKTAPQSQQTALVAAGSLDDVISLLSHVDGSLDGALNAFEVMWQEHYEMIVQEGGHQWVLPKGYPFYVVVEATGADEASALERFESILADAIEDGRVQDAVVCSSHAQRDAVWAIREDVDTFLRVFHPPINFDVSVPIVHMEEYVANLLKDMAKRVPEARGTFFGHLGDNNLHCCWTVGSDDQARKAAVCDVVYENLVPFGGAVSAEHGIGRAKQKYLSLSRNDNELKWMGRVKALFDPQNILNPDRVVNIKKN